ncbi:hypothetical protein IMZ48_23750 [Candidatus Bathyarchaeota archaeon]|nr:hypothetical protein [Candidatus Bathyarchaeota archaeon]
MSTLWFEGDKIGVLTDMNRIWTHNIRGIEFHETFQSKSCPGNDSTPQMAATIAAGEVDLGVYEALDKHGAVVVGGANPVSPPQAPTAHPARLTHFPD